MEEWRESHEATQQIQVIQTSQQFINQVKSLTGKIQNYLFWEYQTDNTGCGVIGHQRLGKKESIVSVSSQKGLQVLMDSQTSFDLQSTLKVLIDPKMQIAKGCMCGVNAVATQKVPCKTGQQAVLDFIQAFQKAERVHKLGICEIKTPEDQVDEQLLRYQKDDESPAFKLFLSFIGEEIQADDADFQGYRGDLPSGHFSFYYLNAPQLEHELVYHVCSRLPYKKSDEQMIERKRHIGNDSVVVLFRNFDGCVEESFQPEDFITSKFIKVYILLDVLEATEDDVSLHIRVFTRQVEDQSFTALQSTEGWMSNPEFRQQLLTLFINCCSGVYQNPQLKERRSQTWETTIRNNVLQK